MASNGINPGARKLILIFNFHYWMKIEWTKGTRTVNTVYFVTQARGNTQISRTEFVYAMNEHAIANVYSVIFELPSSNVRKIYTFTS